MNGDPPYASDDHDAVMFVMAHLVSMTSLAANLLRQEASNIVMKEGHPYDFESVFLLFRRMAPKIEVFRQLAPEAAARADAQPLEPLGD